MFYMVIQTFFQIGTVALSVLMQYFTASRESLLCGEEIPIITLASVIGTTLWKTQKTSFRYNDVKVINFY